MRSCCDSRRMASTFEGDWQAFPSTRTSPCCRGRPGSPSACLRTLHARGTTRTECGDARRSAESRCGDGRRRDPARKPESPRRAGTRTRGQDRLVSLALGGPWPDCVRQGARGRHGPRNTSWGGGPTAIPIGRPYGELSHHDLIDGKFSHVKHARGFGGFCDRGKNRLSCRRKASAQHRAREDPPVTAS